MTRLDLFESVFRSATRTVYEHSVVSLRKVLVVTDLEAEAAKAYTERISAFLGSLGEVEVEGAHRDCASVGTLLDRVQEARPDLVVTYRNLFTEAWHWPYTLGDHVEVLTQVTATPVLLLPRPEAGAALERCRGTLRVMAVTDHLTGDDHLVDLAAAFTARGGTLYLSHVEDDAIFERYMETIAKTRDVDTEIARKEIGEQLLKEPRDYIESCAVALKEAGRELDVEAIVVFGHHLSVYRDLLEQHGADLLVMNTKDHDQLAMHGLAYPLAVELRDVPLLML